MDILKKIEDKEKRFDSYYKKLDADFKLWDLEEIKYETHETAINVTTNEPRLFADDVQTDLASAEMQIIVRTLEHEEIEREEAGKLERLFCFLLEKADDRLINMGLPPMRETIIWLFTIRGSGGVRILNYMEEGKIIPDYMALDPRWLTYEFGKNGLFWVASKTFKTKGVLQDEWGWTPKGASFYTPWAKEKETYPVYDYWEMVEGKAVNTVFCEKDVVNNEKYDLKSLPFLLMPVTSRMPMVTADNLEQGRYGESIYASKRAMYELASKLATTWATHAKILAKQPLLNYIDDEGIRLDSTVMFADGVLNLNRGKQEILPSPLKEISPTLINLVGWVEDKISRGQTPHIGMTSPPPSGTMANIYREAGNRIYNPQIRALSHFYAGICRMIKEQLLMGGVGGEKIKKIKVEAEKEGKYYAFDITPVNLKKPHTIRVEFTVKTPWSQMDVAQQASMLKGLGLPDRWIWEFILKVPDPKLLEDLAVIEMVEHDPLLARKKAVEVLMKYGRKDDADALVREMDRQEAMEKMMVEQQGTPGSPPERLMGQPEVAEAPTEEMPPRAMGEGLMPPEI